MELLITNVPGLSGAMIKNHDNSNLFYTMASGMNSNVLYELPIARLADLIDAKKTTSFQEVAQKRHEPFSGLSFSLFQTPEHLIYYNTSLYGTYTSYMIHKDTGLKVDLDLNEDCYLFGVFNEEALLNCKNQGLKLSSFLDLFAP